MRSNITEDQGLRGRVGVFRDRGRAGGHLAEMVRGYRGTKRFVLAIPAGGVPVGKEVSRALSLPFDIIVVKKLQVPWEPEAGFGAVGLEGEPFLNTLLIMEKGITKEVIESSIRAARDEIRRRLRMFRGERSYPDLSATGAIVVDDGLASGYTMLAAIAEVKRLGASNVTVAVPTASESAIYLLSRNVDEVVCPNVRGGPYFAVADAYVEWHDLADEEVKMFLSVP